MNDWNSKKLRDVMRAEIEELAFRCPGLAVSFDPFTIRVVGPLELRDGATGYANPFLGDLTDATRGWSMNELTPVRLIGRDGNLYTKPIEAYVKGPIAVHRAIDRYRKGDPPGWRQEFQPKTMLKSDGQTLDTDPDKGWFAVWRPAGIPIARFDRLWDGKGTGAAFGSMLSEDGLTFCEQRGLKTVHMVAFDRLEHARRSARFFA